MKLTKVFALPLLAGALLLAPSAKADIVNGILNITGSVRVTDDTLDFLPLGGGDGVFRVDPFTQTGDFVPLAGTTGDITDLTGHPIGVPFAPELFLTFNADPSLQFYLTFIAEGVFGPGQCFLPPASGQNCTPPPGNLFNLTNVTADSSVASFVVRGYVTDGSGDPVSNFVGTFSTQFTDKSYQELLADVFGPQGPGFVQATYSANFIVTGIPEPGTVSMLMCGGVGLIGYAIRRQRRRVV